MANEARLVLQTCDDWIKRTCLIIRRTEITQVRVRFAAQTGPQFRYQAGLADAWVARKQHQPTSSRSRHLPAAQEKCELLLSIHQRHEASSVKGSEAIANGAFLQHTPRPHACREALERKCTEITASEQAADLSPRDVIDHDAVRFCDFLKPSGKIWRSANRRLLPRLAGTDGLADHDCAGRDADANMQCLAVDRRFRHCRHDGKGGSHSTLGIRFLAFGPAEIAEYTVTDITRYVAAELIDRGRHPRLIGADHVGQVLRIQSP